MTELDNKTTERRLCGGSSHQTRWYPIPVNEWRAILETLSFGSSQLISSEEIRSNLAYNLQYLEYLQQTLRELNLSSVLTKQTYKSYIIVAASIVESFMFFLNKESGGKDKRFFDVLNSLEKKSVFGGDRNIYKTLHDTRELRNKIHLHEFRDELGTDYATFGLDEFESMKETLYRLFTDPRLGIPNEKHKYFEFLQKSTTDPTRAMESDA